MINNINYKKETRDKTFEGYWIHMTNKYIQKCRKVDFVNDISKNIL